MLVGGAGNLVARQQVSKNVIPNPISVISNRNVSQINGLGEYGMLWATPSQGWNAWEAKGVGSFHRWCGLWIFA
jgi:hypothetical protein